MMVEEEKQLLIHLPVCNSFELEKAVCSHGLFMMAPNLWIPSAKTLQRPLRLADSTTTAIVRISQHPPLSSLHIWVFGLHSLSLEDEHAIKSQVTRMLRISDDNNKQIDEFHKIHSVAKEKGFGRVFRSPTLFEDMVKCILLCNCQWSRTLSMARALCELQLELKGDPLGCSTVEAAYPNEVCLKAEDFLPKTPVRKERKRKRGGHKRVVTNLESEFVNHENDSTIGVNSSINSNGIPTYPQDEKLSPSVLTSVKEDSSDKSDSFQLSTDSITDTCPINNPHMQESSYRIGDFPRPEELATLDENYLTKRCRLGYRAKRILKLAQSIVENRFQLRELEEVCDGLRSSTYDEMTQQLSGVAGFGSFTRANVLMCMGFYERIPADSETVRHLKQFHARRECTIRTVQQDGERIYEKYAPFQFLAYWFELWDCYEKRFGKLSEMPHSDYKLITGNNMRKRIS
eukprot:TRINITY_DN16751_c0_g1_i1.p1 TRINITY_DN16751_c0_g1~~TRINITY_DN16751_c0_g1_i1.p1  ORF type:complete len:459 (+),score=84.04 TRINITY_DN16751_c0_g1_i1:242-1618(+)